MDARSSSHFALVSAACLSSVTGCAHAAPRTNGTTVAAVASPLAAVDAVGAPPSSAERAFARGVAPATAEELTAALTKDVGRHVALTCEVQIVVRGDAMIGQCGKSWEPVDIYVLLATEGLRKGDRLRVLGEMAPPSRWIDATGHEWLTGMIRAAYVRRTPSRPPGA